MFADFKKCRTFASLLKRKCKGVQLSWFRASALQAEGRRFESVNAHYQKESLTKKFVRLFLFLTSFIQTFFVLLPYNSGKRVNFAV